MAGKRQNLRVGSTLPGAGLLSGGLLGAGLLGAVLVAPAFAEPVPLPTPAPLPKERSSAQQPAAQPSGPANILSGIKNLFNLDKQPEAPAAATPAAVNPGAFTPAQRSQVDKVSAYLSSVQQLVGTFVQVGPDGRKAKGDFYIQKPGKVRFEYEPPSPIEIVADGQSVVVRDRKLATQDLYPLSQTPLRFLLSDRIDLLKDTNVVGVRSDDAYVSITIEEKHAVVGTSRLVMMMGAKDYQLKQWTVTDPQGFDTTVVVSSLDASKRPDPGMFKIDYTRYVQ
ncbi:MAG: outer membrane lipoprotein carrier protein LolA [Hyphomicrobiales bacterium]|nr:outer membrane lipoprotein carrier protein LolA [Hyphomicrobiales bacterium]